MTQKKTYRNALRSRRMIKNAFIELAMKKDISKIKVKEVVELADISRGTFYSHYKDIYTVLDDIENDNIDQLISFFREQPEIRLVDDFSPFISHIIEHIEDNIEFYDMLFNSSVAHSIVNKLQKVFVEIMIQDKKTISQFKSEIEANLFFTFIAVGTANLICKRYTEIVPISNEELISLLNRSIMSGIGALKIK